MKAESSKNAEVASVLRDVMQRSAELNAFLASRNGCNLVGSSAGMVLAASADRVAGGVVIAPTIGDARSLADDILFFGLESVQYLPTHDEAGLFGVSGLTAFGRRVDIAEQVLQGEQRGLVVASVTSILQSVPKQRTEEVGVLDIHVGDVTDRDELVERLAAAEFERAPLVETPGQYSPRGAVVDVFDYISTHPVRIEFDGDQVVDIRSFASETQLSVQKHNALTLSMVAPTSGAEDGCPAIDLLGGDVPLWVRDPDRVEQALQNHAGAESTRALSRIREGATYQLSRLPGGVDAIDFNMGAIASAGSGLERAIETLDSLSSGGDDVCLLFQSDAEKHRFWDAVNEEAEPLMAESLLARPIRSQVGGLSAGFRWRDESWTLINHRELFDIALARRPIRADALSKGRAIDDFVDLAPGDVVVHIAQGIALFKGIEHIEKGGEEQEFLSLEFRDGVLLYVPVVKADLVQRYVGGNTDAPRLSKLGGRSWARTKDGVQAAVSDLAAELLETQALREGESGFSFPEDGAFGHEFEAAFPYTETPDQLVSIEAIRCDMESARPMDRLLCGDVGYGKTEVAMRAAFKAVCAGKQVVVLVPTTVLAEQHTVSFGDRMADYPVNIACLSRFRTAKEQKLVLVGLREKRVDIVIGTHRLLSKDVAFADLGLLIIDEEQRFGVAHKEKLRSLRRSVDVLSMTATPIPRTLHLSLLGVRDISTLTQAPTGRQSVETRLVHFSEALIRDAVLFEMERGGQCFFVHNRVQTIERVRRELSEIVGEARILVIHGQMPSTQIERNLRAFVNREADLLLATTIIESGLDVPNANTIFIDRPDMYGLAELHQLRGRVGRHRVKALAYLLIRPEAIPTSDGEKRLRAIEELNELGSGFRIAMRDLEIRGAGNILGHQQHGHIVAVGYELYCRLLEKAAKNLKSQRMLLPEEVDINLDFEVWLPDSYILSATVKLELYRKLGRARRRDDFAALQDELTDRFGPIPKRVTWLLDVSRIRALCEHVEVQSVAQSEGLGLLLRPEKKKAVLRRLVATGAEYRLIGEKGILLVHEETFGSPADVLQAMRSALLP